MCSPERLFYSWTRALGVCVRDVCGSPAVTNPPQHEPLLELAHEVAIRNDPGTRARYAFDAGNYRVVPSAVAYPTCADEVVKIVRAARLTQTSVTCRGAGTSMAGNAIGGGVVIDFSRSFASITAIDAQAGTATVEPGVVLDHLQQAASPHGLMFGPDPSSRRSATLGGMVGNDACGNHSVRYGRTVDSVIALELVLADGSQVVAERGGLRAADPHDAVAKRLADRINAALRGLADEWQHEIRNELGRIERQVSGYQLLHLLAENGFDVARALVGTEGTCAVVVSATVQLHPLPQPSELVVLGYRSIVEAAADVPTILHYHPSAVEAMDAPIVAAIQRRRGDQVTGGLPAGNAWLLVELDDPQISARQLLTDLHGSGRLRDGRAVESDSDRETIWRIREDGAGLTTRDADDRQYWGGWEDAAVAPGHLASYLVEFNELLARRSLTAAIYGHFGAGCVHARISFDLTTPAGTKTMRRFVQEAAELVVRHGGSLSGEHGDGRARSELLSTMYSKRLLDAFTVMKSTFDPDGLLAPGIIVSPAAIDQALAPLPPANHAATHPLTLLHEPGGLNQAVSRCVGIGRCRSHSGGGMCPSYRATGCEEDSTRGRARTLQEMLRGETITDGWRSTEVRDALDLCLSCKACATDCPVNVDMATYKSEFLYQHYRRRLRPRSHYALGWLPRWLALGRRTPSATNAFMRSPLGRWSLSRIGGVTDKRQFPEIAKKPARLRVEQPARPGATLFVDTFTRTFRPELVEASARVLADAGILACPSEGTCCGLTWITTGQLGTARRILRRTIARLDTGDADQPIIVLEPSCAAVLRDEAAKLVPGAASERVSNRVRSVAAVLDQALDQGWTAPQTPTEVLLQVHCHEQAGPDRQIQRRLLSRLGVATVNESVGCCGLAGNFGFERDHYNVSMDVAELSLAPLLRAVTADAPVLADGFSCQTQISHLSPRDAAHLVEFIDHALTTNCAIPTPAREEDSTA